MSSYLKEYEDKLNEIDHYTKYPEMKPWIGEDYSKDIKVLFIGESHYLAKDTTYHHDVEKWYEGLNINDKKDKGWFTTRNIIKSYSNKTVKRRSRLIFLNMGKALLSSKLFKNKNDHDAYSIYNSLAFLNFFQRPAEITGDSIKVKKLDKTVSNNTVIKTIEIIEPNIVIFGSRLAFKHANETLKYLDTKAISYICSPHPSSAWWNKIAKKYGNKRGKDVIIDFLNSYITKTSI